MRLPILFFVVAFAASLLSCGPEPKPSAPEPAKKAELPKPRDESRRFPQANLIDTKLVDRELMGKPFMPGGTLARYKKGKTKYEMFVAKLPTPNDAAMLLPDWRTALTGAKFVPSFGGYLGQDSGRPVFVFCKGAWIAGIAGLPEKEADLQARILAARLD
jgi:hypothetical protein